MTNKQQLLLSILLYTILSPSVFTTGDPQTNIVKEICNSTIASDSPNWANYFVTGMDYLSTDVAQKGYGMTFVGNGTNTWYGLSQCFEDLDSVDCTLCYSELRSLMPKCYPYIGGRLYLDGCFARYENYTFFDEVLGTQDTSICNSTKSLHSNFSQAVNSVLTNVTSQAINSKGGFAKGYIGGENTTTAYAMAQCWEVLNQSECATCLNAAKASLSTCGSATEGRALFTGCFVRYSNELFWNVYDSGSNSKGKKEIIWIVLGSVLGILLLVLPVLVWKKRGFWKKSGHRTSIKIPEEIAKSSLNFRYEELRKATDNFNLSNKLGQGSYGSVYKAILRDGKEVAVKRLFMNTTQFLDQFFNEVDLISKIRHKNLVKLLGFSADGPESLLVYEFFPNTSLDLFIFDSEHNKRKLDLQQRIEIIQGIAEGISYLHEESETRIIHRDIKASNILLDNNFKPKLTDFGLARIFSIDKTHLSTGIAGTLGYMAPEYIVHGHLTEKADVYSFGILSLEIITGKRCGTSCGSSEGSHVSHSLLSMVWENYKSNSISKIIDQNLYHHQNAKDENEIINMVHIGLLCTQANSSDRPAMSKVVELLRSRDNLCHIALNDPPFFRVDVTEEEEDLERGEGSGLLSKDSSIPRLSGR
ncbi:hypothetical protein LUZ60_017498 [Juncus effusus]|nr:hypothetical protein LUZ60_017498 [Juncus effusus]